MPESGYYRASSNGVGQAEKERTPPGNLPRHAEPTVENPRPARSAHAAPTMYTRHAGFTAAIDSMFLHATRDRQLHITVEHLLAVLLIGLIFAVRATNLNFNALYLDEAIYTTVGEDVLAGNFSKGATSWMFGSYLYPVMATAADKLAGVAGLRLLSAVLTTAAALAVYAVASRLFDRRAGLWALFVFGLSAISINLGQHAVYDALGVPLLAVAGWCIVNAMHDADRQKRYLTWAGVSFSLSVLAKYIGLLYLPALIAIALVLHIVQGRGLRSFIMGIPWLSFVIPIVLILGIYAAFYHEDLPAVFSGQFASQRADRGAIVAEILQEIGVPLLLFAVGLLLVARKGLRRLQGRPWLRLLFALSLPVLAATLLVLPLYHLATANARSLWKHNVYALIFIAPLAGYAIAVLVRAVIGLRGRLALPVRLVSAVVTAIAVFAFASDTFYQNRVFHYSWPDSTGVIEFMRAQGITPESRVLSSSYAIYEYYFDFGTADRDVWNNVWYTEYGSLTGEAAVRQAIEECSYDMIVLENYYAPEWSGELETLLRRAGYAIAYSQADHLLTGADIVTNVHIRPANMPCQGGQ
ncbi:MAG: glycosyltransferase family 39 protein [Chloroflexi bacterium]|nr:glycosyltransferase family 39 protein [Chloroflexota bacterium]